MERNKKTIFRHLGMMAYQEAWDYQTELFNETIALKLENRKKADRGESQQITSNYLLFCEHPHVYTLGKSGKPEHLLLNEQQMEQEEVTFFKINRGGDITYHGPGQIVGYPILDLENFFTDIHKYMRLMEEAVILTLAEYGVRAGRIEGLTGVWIDFEEGGLRPRKICAMGVKSSRWVTMHGFALNINTDLGYFGNIVPCGISDKAVTSLKQELGREVPMQEVEEVLKKHLAEQFEMELTEEVH